MSTTPTHKKPTAPATIQVQQSQSNFHSAEARRYDAQFHDIGIPAVAGAAQTLRKQPKKPVYSDVPAVLRQPSED